MQFIDGVLVLSPTDLVAFSGCEHRSHLDLLVARGELERPSREDAFTDVLRKHGILHETRHLESLRDKVGRLEVIDRPAGTMSGLRAAEGQTLAAMRRGVDVIYQASFFDGRWRGHADFLRRVESESGLGAWGYEAHDTKLARRTKAGTLLQLADYSRHLARLQGVAPRSMHVVLGDDTVDSFLFSDVSAYLETVRARFEEAVDRGLIDTSPDPVAMCDYCAWKDRCTRDWRRTDHLSFVAGIRRDQRARLVAAGVSTRTALAELPSAVAVPQLRDGALAVLREQAALQVQTATEDSIAWDLIEPDPETPQRGLASLPAPSPGDIFFDMEGDQFVGTAGREYLFGWVEGDHVGAPFRTLWAHGPDAERAAFETFIDTVIDRRRRDPSMHVYHYAAYEPAALKKLMGRYATREEEVDALLRAGVFVDLYRAVMQGVRIGVESYSLKKLEPLYMAARAGQITDAGSSIVQYELWLDERNDAILESIRCYNEDDCRSLVALRGWLEARRAELERRTGPLPRPALVEGAASDLVAAGTAEADRLAAELTEGIAADPRCQTTEQRALSLLAALLDWHRRDAKPGWWEYFARRDASDDELVDDASSIGGLVFEGDGGIHKRSRLYRFSFPVQETKLKAGDNVEDPRTRDDATRGRVTRRAGTIHDIDPTRGFLVLKCTELLEPMPKAVIGIGQPDTAVLRAALLRVGEWVRDRGVDSPGSFRAIRDLLLRNRPRIAGVRDGEALRCGGEDVVSAARRSIGDADATCLPVQGPPGSGKTFTGAVAILDLVTATPRRPVAVTALSHRAITHLLSRACEEARKRGVTIRVMQRSDDERGCDDPQVQCVGSSAPIVAALEEGTVDVVAGTAWLLARPDMAGRVDTLFVDEAGQLSLANVMAVGGCARNVVLLGDPQQLAQPSAGSHPPGADASGLGHVLEDAETIAPDRGLFLDVTWRMHPDVCSYISDIFYDSRLMSAADNVRQRVRGEDELSGTGLRWLPVVHAGNRSASEQEAAAVERLVSRLIGRNWVDRHGIQQPLTAADILVVAPYNAHVAALRRHLPEAVAVGTVDRFQGQQAAVVIYSMATSFAEDVPRGMDFLYSRNRMNVAISRARCLAILVCSPDLLHVFCTRASTIPLVNALCAFVQRASVVRDPAALDAAQLGDAQTGRPAGAERPVVRSV